jgi:hypothetical protein
MEINEPGTRISNDKIEALGSKKSRSTTRDK